MLEDIIQENFEFLFVLVSLSIYFLPTIVGVGRKKIDSCAIFVLNLLLGWTVIGWIVALVWAFKKDKH